MGRVFSVTLLVVLCFWFLASCVGNPFGITKRTQLKYQAEVDIAQIQADAQVDVAQWETTARIKEAEENTEAISTVAKQQRITSQTWAQTLPTLFFIIVAGAVVCLIVVYRGKVAVLLAEQGVITPLFPEWQKRAPSQSDPVAALRQYAQEHGQYIREENGYYLLIDSTTHQVVKQLARK